MIDIDNIESWKKIETPYGSGEVIPVLLSKLFQNFNEETFEELMYDYLYHQNTTYSSTLATLPYLLELLPTLKNDEDYINLIISTGTILLFVNNDDLDSYFNEDIELQLKHQIKQDYLDAFQQFKTIVEDIAQNPYKECSDIYFLITYLVTKGRYKEAEVFFTFSANDEYVFCCSNCDAEYYLENSNNQLKVYKDDTVFNKEQEEFTQIVMNQTELNWLENLIHQFSMVDYLPILPYFKGNLTCSCGVTTTVFEGILESHSW